MQEEGAGLVDYSDNNKLHKDSFTGMFSWTGFYWKALEVSRNNYSRGSCFSDELHNLPRFIKQTGGDEQRLDFRSSGFF